MLPGAISQRRKRGRYPQQAPELETGLLNRPLNDALRDGMRLTVLVKSTDSSVGLVVPASAILRDGLQTFVFVQKSDDYLERRRVVTGRSDGVFIGIKSGIVAGEAVVSAGGRELQTAFSSLR